MESDKVYVVLTNYPVWSLKPLVRVMEWQEGSISLKPLYDIPIQYYGYFNFFSDKPIWTFDSQGRCYLKINQYLGADEANGTIVRFGPEGKTIIAPPLIENGINSTAQEMPAIYVHKNYLYSVTVSRDTASHARRMELVRRGL